MKLTDSVHLVGGAAYGYSAVGDCNLYLVDCGTELMFVDAGCGLGVKQVIENIKRIGFAHAQTDNKMNALWTTIVTSIG